MNQYGGGRHHFQRLAGYKDGPAADTSALLD